MATTLTDRRTFRSNDARDLDTPVDALGRMRFRATLDRSAIRRADEDDSTEVRFGGHAAVFGKRTWIGGKRWGFWESIEKGAFAKTIGEADVRFLINHDPNLLVARNKAGTLRLSEDAVGLASDADMDTRQSYVADLVVSLERGDISQMSFAFEPIAWRFEEAEDGKDHYVLTELRLWDVAVVTYPAYEDTDAGLRSAGFEALTRSLGLDAAEVLGRIDDLPDLDAYLRAQITPGPAETTREPSGPDDSTRDSTTPPPAETTGPPTSDGFDAMRDHRAAELDRLFRETTT